jgi:hypothetical protein
MNEITVPDFENISAEILNAALDMSMEWGENLLKPINKRIIEKFPELTEEQADILNYWCNEVKDFAFAKVAKDYPLEGTAIEEVKQRYPQINNETLTHLLNQGMYYAWHG